MSKVFEGIMERLSTDTGYSYDFLTDKYNECVNAGVDGTVMIKLAEMKILGLVDFTWFDREKVA